jgi:hypothetical protein
MYIFWPWLGAIHSLVEHQLSPILTPWLRPDGPRLAASDCRAGAGGAEPEAAEPAGNRNGTKCPTPFSGRC